MLLYTVLSAVMPLLLVAVLVVGLTRRRPDPVPPGALHAPAPAGRVRVTGEVLPASPLSPVLRVRYPLPDGRDGELRAPVTRPAVLRPGMLVPVLVDPARPYDARLDVPAHASVVGIVTTVWLVIGVTVGVAGLSALVLWAVL